MECHTANVCRATEKGERLRRGGQRRGSLVERTLQEGGNGWRLRKGSESADKPALHQRDWQASGDSPKVHSDGRWQVVYL